MQESEALKIFTEYFSIFPWKKLRADAVGFDMGCGTGRWARFVIPKVSHLNCIDPSSALEVARMRLKDFDNVSFFKAAVDDVILPSNSQDFGYSLGVLHHVPDTAAAIRSCVELLKPGAPFLLYLYYNFENKSCFYRWLWKISDLARRVIVKFPPWLKQMCSDFIALTFYWPVSRACWLLSIINFNTVNIPLSYYRNHSLYVMRTDARDRFGTPLEHRFSRREITDMMLGAGLTDIKFSECAPYWCAVGSKEYP
jgi:SAM-dependent methyltransferase